MVNGFLSLFLSHLRHTQAVLRVYSWLWVKESHLEGLGESMGWWGLNLDLSCAKQCLPAILLNWPMNGSSINTSWSDTFIIFYSCLMWGKYLGHTLKCSGLLLALCSGSLVVVLRGTYEVSGQNLVDYVQVKFPNPCSISRTFLFEF